MRPADRVVTELPLRALFDAHGEWVATPRRDLSASEVADLLRDSPILFVVANVGQTLRWIPVTQRFAFWRDAKLRILEPRDPIQLDRLPGGYGYRARLWSAAQDVRPVVVLELVH